nr:very short patch repair endonuclease [Spirosoma panaciterrae]
MSRVRSKDTKPELIVRKFLHAHGFRYRLHDKNLPGKPDIVLPKYKTVIFVHGNFSYLDSRRTDFGFQPLSEITVWKNAQRQ